MLGTLRPGCIMDIAPAAGLLDQLHVHMQRTPSACASLSQQPSAVLLPTWSPASPPPPLLCTTCSLQPRQRPVRLAAAGPGGGGPRAYALAHCQLPRTLVQLQLCTPGEGVFLRLWAVAARRPGLSLHLSACGVLASSWWHQSYGGWAGAEPSHQRSVRHAIPTAVLSTSVGRGLQGGGRGDACVPVLLNVPCPAWFRLQGEGEEMRKAMEPVLYEHGVDFVFCGEP